MNNIQVAEELYESVRILLDSIGSNSVFSLHPISGGANNRGYRVETDPADYFLKEYFVQSSDKRDRLVSEYLFTRFAWDNGIRTVPEPLACETDNKLGLYEFVAGRTLARNEITEDMTRQALGFYRELNRFRNSAMAAYLPDASENCSSVIEHLGRVYSRLSELLYFERTSDIDNEASDFVQCELAAAYEIVSERIQNAVRDEKEGFYTRILNEDIRISPADFGFHNAILEESGRLRFIDFEYAGWDDPVKIVCDIFCRPDMAPPVEHLQWFADEVFADLHEPENHKRRFELSMPICRLKWVCIQLNEFLPAGAARRSFAGGDVDMQTRKQEQLNKAKLDLQNIRNEYGLV